MKLTIPPPQFDDATRAFHERHCGNHYYMAKGMALHPEIWSDTERVAQLVYLEALSGKPNKYVVKRLIQRYHVLACKQDVAAVEGR